MCGTSTIQSFAGTLLGGVHRLMMLLPYHRSSFMSKFHELVVSQISNYMLLTKAIVEQQSSIWRTMKEGESDSKSLSIRPNS